MVSQPQQNIRTGEGTNLLTQGLYTGARNWTYTTIPTNISNTFTQTTSSNLDQQALLKTDTTITDSGFNNRGNLRTRLLPLQQRALLIPLYSTKDMNIFLQAAINPNILENILSRMPMKMTKKNQRIKAKQKKKSPMRS